MDVYLGSGISRVKADSCHTPAPPDGPWYVTVTAYRTTGGTHVLTETIQPQPAGPAIGFIIKSGTTVVRFTGIGNC